MSRIVVLGGFEKYDFLVEELLVILFRTIFFGLVFFCWDWLKLFDLVQRLRITYKLCRKM